MSGLRLHRIGTVMEPEPGNGLEEAGVLNPAVVRGPDGALYLFPRLVAKGNYSRIGIARVQFNASGDPCGVERLGIALEPEAPYEKRPNGGGGCEDPRISFFEPLQQYVMTYTAFSSNGPRIALAMSKDLLKWERLGLAKFAPFSLIEFDQVDNKDACIFPGALSSPHGHRSMVMLHRPLFPGTTPEANRFKLKDRRIRDHHECIWISFSHLSKDGGKTDHLPEFASSRPLALPEFPWENLKIGAGTPPVLTKHGWLLLYHGVREADSDPANLRQLIYSAGLMILDVDQPDRILYRSPNPVLSPELSQEKVGMIADVVFPTGIDQRNDLGMPDRFDIYYGMADNRIGVARLDLPDRLPV